MVPGNGVGGTVIALGPGVDEAWLGRLVVSGTGGSGGYAERVAVAVSGLIEIPAGVTVDDAVALLADGRTAEALVRAAALRPGERALVEAAGGGVGTVLTQLCVLAGARVIGAARGADKLRLARDLGAEQTVNYTEPGWAESVRAGAGGVEVVFDGVGGPIAAEAFELLGPGGRMLSYGMASGSFAQISHEVATARGVTLIRGVPVSPAEAAGLTRAALTEAAAGLAAPSDRAAVPARRRRGRACGDRVPLDHRQDPAGGDPVSDITQQVPLEAFDLLAHNLHAHARQPAFTRTLGQTLWVAVALQAVTFALAFLLPRRARPQWNGVPGPGDGTSPDGGQAVTPAAPA